MAEIYVDDDRNVVVTDQGETLTYSGTEVTTSTGRVIRHESRGGELVSAATATVGDIFVEISYLGDGPEGGELAMVATLPDLSTVVALGGLVTDQIPSEVPHSWPNAIDRALGLIVADTIDSGTKEEIEDFHQRLLGVIFG